MTRSELYYLLLVTYVFIAGVFSAAFVYVYKAPPLFGLIMFSFMAPIAILVVELLYRGEKTKAENAKKQKKEEEV